MNNEDIDVKIREINSNIADIHSMGSLPLIEEGLIRIDEQLSNLRLLIPNNTDNVEMIKMKLDELCLITATAKRLARREAEQSKINKDKWKFK